MQKTMNQVTSFSLLLLLLVVGFVLADETIEKPLSHPAISEHSLEHQPKFLDFTYFQKSYQRIYTSKIELIRRTKLYYARVMRVFLVGLQYINKLSTKYLKITYFSDLTEDERLKIFVNRETNIIDNNRQEINETSISKNENENKEIIRNRRDTKKTDTGQIDHGQSTDNNTFISRFITVIKRIASANTKQQQQHDKNATHRAQEMDEVYLDYRETGCLADVKSQMFCGACYIFCMIPLYEYQYCIQKGELVEFSEQYAIDCGRRSYLSGCSGGREQDVYNFVQNYGLELMSNHPFKEIEQQCPYNSFTKPKEMGPIRVKSSSKFVTKYRLEESDSITIERFLKKHGPLYVSLSLYDSFLDYGGGVDMMTEGCILRYGHGMTLIGHGIENGKEYFLFRNSFGSDWGESGYYKLSKTFNRECLIRYGYIKVQFNSKLNKARKNQ